jgi:hypothetical protein
MQPKALRPQLIPTPFHAKYGDYEAVVGIQDGVVEGQFPGLAMRLVLEWYEIHRGELMEDWLLKERRLAQPQEAWREITLAEGAQRLRTYRFSAQRVRETRNRQPGGVLWAVYRQNLDGSEPCYYLSNGPEDTPLETLARVGGSRWPIETEFETEKTMSACRINDW